MREFAFELEYDSGVNPLIDVFREYPDLSSSGIDGVIDEQSICRIERISGPSEGIETVETCLETHPGEIEAITEMPCDLSIEINVLERSESQYDIFIRLNSIRNCDSIHTVARQYLGRNVVFEFERTEATERWRVIHRDEDRIGLFYDTFQTTLRSGISFRFDRLGAAHGWEANLFSGIEVSAEQQTALIAAVKNGYYETPREITLDDLAKELGWPRSTLSYRLRQAEASLAKAFTNVVDA